MFGQGALHTFAMLHQCWSMVAADTTKQDIKMWMQIFVALLTTDRRNWLKHIPHVLRKRSKSLRAHLCGIRTDELLIRG